MSKKNGGCVITGKINDVCWFDNKFAKPPQIDQIEGYGRYSIRVLFEVGSDGGDRIHSGVLNGMYWGQYDFTESSWHPWPDSVLNKIPDKCVVAWMMIPNRDGSYV